MQETRLSKEAEKIQARREQERRRERDAPLRAARKHMAREEEAVNQVESRIRDLESALAHPELYDGSQESAEEAGRLNAAIRDARASLDEAMARWAEASEAVELLEKGGKKA
jgi:hypothetical protein